MSARGFIALNDSTTQISHKGAASDRKAFGQGSARMPRRFPFLHISRIIDYNRCGALVSSPQDSLRTRVQVCNLLCNPHHTPKPRVANGFSLLKAITR